MMNNNGMMCADKTIKYDPAKSVLKYRIEDDRNKRENMGFHDGWGKALDQLVSLIEKQ